MSRWSWEAAHDIADMQEMEGGGTGQVAGVKLKFNKKIWQIGPGCAGLTAALLNSNDDIKPYSQRLPGGAGLWTVVWVSLKKKNEEISCS